MFIEQSADNDLTLNFSTIQDEDIKIIELQIMQRSYERIKEERDREIQRERETDTERERER